VRNLTKTIAAVSLLVPASAYPLGIGEIKLHSALNQKLNAEIALIVDNNEDASAIKVKLAPPEKFDEAGVPWSYFLSKIKFEPVIEANGTVFVKLSSQETLREPFLDFLLEVTWEKGSLYREFTVLVDPPAAYSQPIIPVVDKVKQVEKVEIVQLEIEETVAGDQVQLIDVETEIIVETINAEYGPTTRSDSLWKVAEKVNPYNDISIEQMMMAIFDANPRAFYKDNVNALMAGETLSIPEKEVILKLSKKQALAVFKQQDKAWRGRVTTAKTTTEQVVDDNIEIQTQLELEAPIESEITETVTVVSETEAGVDSVTVIETEKIVVVEREGEIARQAQMEKLEQQLLMMQKMLVLKDEQIAALQFKKDGKALAPTETKAIDSVKTDSTAEATEKDPKQTAVKPEPTVKPKPVAKPKPVVKPKPEPEADYFSLIAGGAGVAILAALGWLFWRKRKIEDETDTESMFAAASEISLPDSSTNEDDLSLPALDDTSYDVGTVGESSFLSEFTPSDFDAFDTDQNEVDPISEADVYLAYGRYQQAEDLMRQAIVDQPDRNECKLKLLEIFYANENKDAFEVYAKELVESGKHNDQEFWAKVVEMGVEMDPASSLYSDRISDSELASFDVASDATASETIVESELSETGSQTDELDMSVFDGGDENSDSKEEATAEDDGLDFDLSVFDLDETETQQKQEPVDNVDEESLETVDFDLNAFALDDTESEDLETKKTEVDDEIESFDFDLDLDKKAEGVAAPESEDEKLVLSPEDDTEESLEDFDFSLDEAPGTSKETEPEVETKTESFDEFDFDFDLDELPATADKPETELDLGVADLTDMDELETKLDLAKAYVDMGDAEAAKSIAEEVLEKGNAEQKQTAQEIIKQLS